jgi:hypothetical protein
MFRTLNLGVGKIQGCCEFVLELEFSDCKLELVEGPATNTFESNCS